MICVNTNVAIAIKLIFQPTKDLTDGELDGTGEIWNGKSILRLFKNGDRAIAAVHKNRFFVGIDQPAHLSAAIETMQDIANDFGLILIGRKDLDRPIWGNENSIGNFAVAIARNPVPSENGNIRDDRSASKRAAEFWKSAGNLLGSEDLVNSRNKVSLNGAMLSLGHWFLNNLTVDKLAGRFGFR